MTPHTFAAPAEATSSDTTSAPSTSAAFAPATIWQDQTWRLSAGGPTGLPFSAVLTPRQMLMPEDLDTTIFQSLGSVLAGIREALMADEDIADVEVQDSLMHDVPFRVHVLARPLEPHGNLALLSEMLPETHPEILRDRGLRVAEALGRSERLAS